MFCEEGDGERFVLGILVEKVKVDGSNHEIPYAHVRDIACFRILVRHSAGVTFGDLEE